MAAASPVLDDLIKEYLLFRGFTSTLKAFENDIKGDKDKSFKVISYMRHLKCFLTWFGVKIV